MKKNFHISVIRHGFSLAEILAAMVIGSMVLIAVLTVYTRAERTVVAVADMLDDSRLPYEVLQLIAEDFDKIISSQDYTDISIMNQYENNYLMCIIAIRKQYKDPTDKAQEYEEIMWHCNADYGIDTNDLILYRGYEGKMPEDKLLDRDKDAQQKTVRVPICRGVTYFKVEVITDSDKPSMVYMHGVPHGIIVTISFAKPFKDAKGHFDVPENQKYKRTIAIDKSRKLSFEIPEDVNSPLL